MKVLFVAELVGKPGIFALKAGLAILKERLKPDAVIVNGDGATNGFGLGRNHSMYIKKIGVNVITGGDQIYFKKDMVAGFDQSWHVLRPANYPQGNPGRGWRFINVGDQKLAVISLLGLSGFARAHLTNPFLLLPDLLKRIHAETNKVVLDFHSVTTAEKSAMSMFCDGKISACIGTGMRVPTADLCIQKNGCLSISDTGRTGSFMSVAGLDPVPEIQQFVSSIPQRSSETWLGLELQGVFFEIDDKGLTTSCEMIRLPIEPAAEKAGDLQGEEEASEEAPPSPDVSVSG